MGLLDTVLGKLANAPQSLLFNAGMAGLASPSVSRYKRGPFEHFGGAFAAGSQLTSQAQEAAARNDLVRERIAENQRQVAAQQKMQQDILSGKITLPPGMTPETYAALSAAAPEQATKSLLEHLIPPHPVPLTPEAQAMLAAAFPNVQKAQQEARAGEEIRGVEKVTSDTILHDAKEANDIIDRLESGPVVPGSTSASILTTFTDKEGYIPISVSPGTVASAIATATGKPFSDEQAKQFVTDYNRLQKLSSKFVTDMRSLQSQQMASGARQTDQGLSLLEKQNIGFNIDPNANRLILRDLQQRQLDVADVKGFDLKNAESARTQIKALEERLQPYVESGQVTQSAADEAVKAEAARMGYGGTSGRVYPQPAPQYGPEQGGDVEMPPEAVAPNAAPYVPPPAGKGITDWFSSLFGGGVEKGVKAAEAIPEVAAATAAKVQDAIAPVVRKVPTVDVPGLASDAAGAVGEAYNTNVAPIVKTELQRPVIFKAIETARAAGDKVAVAGDRVYALSGRVIGQVVNGVVELKNKSDLNLARDLARKGIRRARVGAKTYVWRD